MSYIEGFVIAVPTANKQKFIDHATLGDGVFMDHGAIRIVECWQEDVPRGDTTDFFRSVQARDDESIVFSWIEWPDKPTRQAFSERMGEIMQSDERFSPDKNPMPFDGSRMIYGGFEPIVDLGTATNGSYVQGFVIAVPEANKEVYRKLAEEVGEVFADYGALRLVEAWQDDVPAGKQTDFFRTVKAEADERVVFSFVEWPSREVCDTAAEKMQADERMQPPAPEDVPFDGKRMIFGGFQPIVTLGD